MSYPFERDDAGRAKSKRPRQKNDCVVRAIALACRYGYDEAYDRLAKLGRKSGSGTDPKAYKPILNEESRLNGIERYLSFPAVKGQRRMTLEAFCERHRRGRFVVRMAKHLTVVIDGVCHDDFEPRGDGCVYGAWRVG